MTTGTIISIVLGVAGIIATYLFTKLQMKRNQIDHFYLNSYDIGKGLTDVFPEFQLHFGNEVLSKNVKVFEGGFINTGRNDVGDNGKKTEITMVFPKECAVKAVKASSVGSVPIVNSYSDEKKNIIVFSIEGLMKCKECFNYTAIIEVPENIGDLEKKLEFDYRIKNTIIRNVYLGQIPHKQITSTKGFFIIVGLLLVDVIFICSMPELLNNRVFGLLWATPFALILMYVPLFLYEKRGKKGRIVQVLLENQKI